MAAQKAQERADHETRQRQLHSVQSGQALDQAAKREVAEAQRLQQRRRHDVVFKRVCQKWSLVSVVNRFNGQADQWRLGDIMKGGDRDLLTCVVYKIVPVNAQGQEVDPLTGEVIESDFSEKLRQKIGANLWMHCKQGDFNRNKGALLPANFDKKKNCGEYLDVVLNRRFSDSSFRDLVPNTQMVNLNCICDSEWYKRNAGNGTYSTTSQSHNHIQTD